MPTGINAVSVQFDAVKSFSPRPKIWIDLDNSPHVPFFRPIIHEFDQRGYEVFITARDAYQVRELLEFYGIPAKLIGKHHGQQKVLKALGTLSRALSLSAAVRREKPVLAMSHGSRGCLVAANVLGIPSINLTDYEFVAKVPFAKPTWLMIPSVVPDSGLRREGTTVMKYPGIKEDVYLAQFRPDRSLRERMGIGKDEVLIMVRPPATEAHYHNPESELLLSETLKKILNEQNTRVVLLPRNKRQEAELKAAWNDAITSSRIIIPVQVEDGLNLIWNSDLVISGGGTMNREAAAMGVPVYSIFRGKIGAVDRYLADEKRLILLETVDDVRTKIEIVRRKEVTTDFDGRPSPALLAIVDHVSAIVEKKPSKSEAFANL